MGYNLLPRILYTPQFLLLYTNYDVTGVLIIN